MFCFRWRTIYIFFFVILFSLFLMNINRENILKRKKNFFFPLWNCALQYLFLLDLMFRIFIELLRLTEHWWIIHNFDYFALKERNSIEDDSCNVIKYYWRTILLVIKYIIYVLYTNLTGISSITPSIIRFISYLKVDWGFWLIGLRFRLFILKFHLCVIHTHDNIFISIFFKRE
jgi:hypothetical protein